MKTAARGGKGNATQLKELIARLVIATQKRDRDDTELFRLLRMQEVTLIKLEVE